MKTTPITLADIDFGDTPGAAPRSPLYDDVYHPASGALAQAQHVFLQGNDLPGRWAGRSRFVVMETGFGLGHNFLATWRAWQDDAARCERLFFVSVERHPASRQDLARAHRASSTPELADALLRAWPAATPNLHLLDFEGGRVQLLLALGDVAALLPTLRLQADAFFLDGFAPARNPAMWQTRVIKALGARAAPAATLATWSAASGLRDSLKAAGFVPRLAPGQGGKREITLAQWAPRFQPRRQPQSLERCDEAVVVGAGLAGAAVARALARLGLQVTVLERQGAPAMEASGNPAGLFHGTVNADDGPYARLFRAAALYAQVEHAAAIARGVPGAVQGLLRLELRELHEGGLQGLTRLWLRTGLPADYVDVMAAEQASLKAGVALAAPAWFYPGGGWVAPGPWVQDALREPGVRLRCGIDVQALRREGEAWALFDGQGLLIQRCATVVLANAAPAQQLLAALGYADWPLEHTRGQVTLHPGPHGLKLPVAGDGYAIPLHGPGLDGSLLCGATRQVEAPGPPTLRKDDHRHNFERLHRLTGLAPPPDIGTCLGRTGWRLHADDRLPVAGALPLAQMPSGQRLDQARLLPREPGLFALTALGARGLTLAPLLARLVAAQATGTPWPLEQDLADAVDPGRWMVRAARAANSA